MFKDLTRHLLLVNICVFLLVLGIFSTVVYASVSHNLDNEERHRLQLLADTLINSIEPEDSDDPDPENAVPDVLQSYDRQEGVYSGRVGVQWYDRSLKFRSEKGTLKINLPFNQSATMETQMQPHALIVTRRVERKGGTLGFIRVGTSLGETDNFKQKLLTGLISGTVLSLLLSGLAILWLVRQSLKPLQISIRKLSQFGADASHELKNPLMAIKTNAAVALKYPEEMRERDREKFELILNAADQMVATTTGLFRLAKAESKVTSSELVQFDVNELISEIVHEFAGVTNSRSISIDMSGASAPMEINAQKEEIRIVLKNIIENAVQYSADGGSITINTARDGNKVKIEIADNGIGISETDLPKIFDRFWRSDKARNHATGGSGLGLSIVETLVKRSRGTVAVKSVFGTGTTFLVTLPTV